MLKVTRRFVTLALLALLAAALSPAAAAQDKPEPGKDEPPFHEYKGVRIGMAADEARKKLGSPADKADGEDFYSISDNESARIFYDTEKKVFAISIIYVGAGSGVPSAKAVLGAEAEAKPDGSVYQRLDFPKSNCWVAYSRTGGDSPLITVTLHKK